MDEQELKELVRAVVVKAMADQEEEAKRAELMFAKPAKSGADTALGKKAANWMGLTPALPPVLTNWNPDGTRSYYLGRTPARLGVGSAGVRPRTDTLLRFITDHAAAKDAVDSSVDQTIASSLGLVSLTSAARDRAEYLRRPDLGRRLSDESKEIVQKRGINAPQVQIVCCDGLSATALNVNLPIILPKVTDGLTKAGIRVGTPFLVNMGRVVAADEVARLTKTEVLLLFVGERPGLKTAESMGAYVTYMKVRQFNEAMRNVVSNIHSGGLPPLEAADQLVEGVLKALREKRTGVDAIGG